MELSDREGDPRDLTVTMNENGDARVEIRFSYGVEQSRRTFLQLQHMESDYLKELERSAKVSLGLPQVYDPRLEKQEELGVLLYSLEWKGCARKVGEKLMFKLGKAETAEKISFGIGTLTSLRIVIPKGWVLLSAKPKPSSSLDGTLVWTDYTWDSNLSVEFKEG